MILVRGNSTSRLGLEIFGDETVVRGVAQGAEITRLLPSAVTRL